jgi:hypothetical protein
MRLSLLAANHFVLDSLRSLNRRMGGAPSRSRPDCIRDADVAASAIRELLAGPGPAMIARFGSSELQCLVNHAGVTVTKHRVLDYIRGRAPPWWWDRKLLRRMNRNAGLFPATEDALRQFSERMMADLPLLDVLGSWLPDETLFESMIGHATKVDLELLNPFFARHPWTEALAGKRVLVVHPFARTIESQYRKRTQLFDREILPQFELMTIRAVQSIAGETTRFESWFDALRSMEEAMDQHDYDVCLVGCGAYGFPLAAHAKRRGRKAVHLGGSLQLLFGIRGRRWESPQYSPDYDYSRLMNEHWVRPADEERPRDAGQVEGACYW